MTQKTRRDLKDRFRAGVVPKEQDLEDLIDSSLNLVDNGITTDNNTTTVTFTNLAGDGSGLTNIDPTNIGVGEFSVERIPALDASKITSGQFAQARIANLNTDIITAGQFALERIPTIPASQVSGTFNAQQVPNINADKITAGVLDLSRIPDIPVSRISGTLSSLQVPNLNANKITDGELDPARIPALNANKITSGSFTQARIPNLNASKIATGTLDWERLPEASDIQRGAVRLATQNELDQEQVTNVAVTPNALARKADRSYVDQQLGSLEAGLKFKADVQAVAAESELGNTSNELALPVLDGYQVEEGDRVLLTQQANRADNRVWIARAGAQWQRAPDTDSDEELAIGVSVEVQNGVTTANSIWTVAPNPDSDASAITWTRRNDINNYIGENGIDINGRVITVDTSWLQSNLFNASDLTFNQSVTMNQGLTVESALTINGPVRSSTADKTVHFDSTLEVGQGGLNIEQTDTGQPIRINSVSDDGSLEDRSNTLATERAVKSYVDNAVAQGASDAMPVGAIIMWSGAVVDIPNSWAICDGSNGTPDLRDRFIVGAGRDYGVGETGGQDSVTLTAAQSGTPAHRHQGSTRDAGNHNHRYVALRANSFGGRELDANAETVSIELDNDNSHTTDVSGSHAHILETNENTATDASEAHENRPRYYALVFIMKTAN